MSELSNFLVSQNLKSDQDTLILSQTEEAAIFCQKQLQFYLNDKSIEVVLFPSADTMPYEGSPVNPEIRAQRCKLLTNFAQNTKKTRVVVTQASNLLTKLPPKNSWKDKILHINQHSRITQREVITFLVSHGFSRTASATSYGEFAMRGEIIDLAINRNEAYRINLHSIKLIRLRYTIPQLRCL